MRRLFVLVLVPFIISACGGGSSPTGPTSCTITPSQTNVNVSATAGSTAVPVQAGSSCAWTVTSSQPWLTITSGTGATGASTVTFSVAENTGAQRVATVTVGGVAVTVTQAAGLPPVTVGGGGVPAQVAVGTAVNAQFTAAGGNGGPYTFSLQTGVGFPPIGWSLSSTGLLAGVANTAGSASFGVCATDTGGRTGCTPVNVTIAPPAVIGGAANGNWGGNIILQVGCTTPLPQTYPWTGTIRTAANGGTELLVSVPTALVFNEVHPLTIVGQRVSFSIDFGVILNFVGDLNAGFTSISGTFTGTNCQIPPVVVIPSGSWNGTKR